MTQEKEKYCHSCGTLIPYYDRHCPACGEQQPTLPGMEPLREEESKEKKVWIAVLLSFLITGLGQYYLGARRRGVAFFAGTLLMGVILSISYTQEQIMGFGVFIAAVSAIDAYQLARRKNQSI